MDTARGNRVLGIGRMGRVGGGAMTDLEAVAKLLGSLYRMHDCTIGGMAARVLQRLQNDDEWHSLDVWQVAGACLEKLAEMHFADNSLSWSGPSVMSLTPTKWSCTYEPFIRGAIADTAPAAIIACAAALQRKREG